MARSIGLGETVLDYEHPDTLSYSPLCPFFITHILFMTSGTLLAAKAVAGAFGILLPQVDRSLRIHCSRMTEPNGHQSKLFLRTTKPNRAGGRRA